MKSLLYLFRRYKLASSLNLFGLILSFTGCYILLTQINFIGSYNHGIRDYENIRRVYMNGFTNDGKWNTTLSRVMAESLEKCPHVESIGYLRSYGDVYFDKDGSNIISPAYLVSDDMLATINTELADGTIEGSKAIDKGIIIPASLAEKYFGNLRRTGDRLREGFGKGWNPSGADLAEVGFQERRQRRFRYQLRNLGAISNHNFHDKRDQQPGTQ